MAERRIRVAIVDDHPMVRTGLKSFLELSDDIMIVGEEDNGLAAVKMVADTEMDVLLMDLVMPGDMDGIAAIRAIFADQRNVRIIALTSFLEPERILAAISAGAVGYLHKDVMPDDLLGAIRQAAAGHIILEPQALDALRRGHFEPNSRYRYDEQAETSDLPATSPLTGREQEVLEALAKGQSNKEIAASLGITEKTVKVHISHILAKLNVYDRTQALIAATRLGLIRL